MEIIPIQGREVDRGHDRALQANEEDALSLQRVEEEEEEVHTEVEVALEAVPTLGDTDSEEIMVAVLMETATNLPTWLMMRSR